RRDEALQGGFELSPQGSYGRAVDIELTDEWIRDAPIGRHAHFACELRLAPYRNRQQIAGLNTVAIVVHGIGGSHRRKCYCGRRTCVVAQRARSIVDRFDLPWLNRILL